MQRNRLMKAVLLSLIAVSVGVPLICAHGKAYLDLEASGSVYDNFDELEQKTFDPVVYDFPVYHTLAPVSSPIKNHVGVIKTEPFLLGDTLSAYVGGSFGAPQIFIELRDCNSDEVLPLTVLKDTKGIEIKQWSIPSNWKARTVQFVMEDNNPERALWVGLARVAETPIWYHQIRNTRLLGYCLMNGILPILVFISIGLVAYHYCCRWFGGGVKYAVLIVFSAPLLLGYGLFYLSLVNSFASSLVSLFVGMMSVAHCAYLIAAKDRYLFRVFREYQRAIQFCFVAVVLNLSVVHLVWSQFSTLRFSQDRFLPDRLANDNALPYDTVELLFSEQGLKPFVMMWRSTDRPPLQAAACLLVRPFFIDAKEGFQAFSTFLQCSVLLGMAAFLKSIRIHRRFESVVLGFLLFSGTFLVNTTFVWPKFFPVLFLFILTGLLFGERHFERGFGFWLSFGVASCWVMLTHPGSIFAIFALLLVYTLIHRKLAIQQVVAAVIVFTVLMLPWMMYQKHYDPPGNMLQKRFIADHPEFDSVPFSDALFESYSKLTFSDWVGGRMENVKTVFFGFHHAFCWHSIQQLGNGSLPTRAYSFVFIAVSLCPVFLGVPLGFFAWRRNGRERRRLYCNLLAVVWIGMSVWIIVILPAGRTIISHGSYYFPAILTVLIPCVLIPRRGLLMSLAGIHFLYYLIVWVLPRTGSVLLRGGRLLDVEVVNPLSWVPVLLSLGWLVYLTLKDVYALEVRTK